MRKGEGEIDWEKERGKGPQIGGWVWRRRDGQVGLTAAWSTGGSDSGVIDGWVWQRRDRQMGLKEATATATRLVCRSKIVLASRRTLSFFTTTLTSLYRIGFSNSLSASFFVPSLRSPKVRSHRLGSASPLVELGHVVHKSISIGHNLSNLGLFFHLGGGLF